MFKGVVSDTVVSRVYLEHKEMVGAAREMRWCLIMKGHFLCLLLHFEELKKAYELMY